MAALGAHPHPNQLWQKEWRWAGGVALGSVVSLVGQATFTQLFYQDYSGEGSTLGPEGFCDQPYSFSFLSVYFYVSHFKLTVSHSVMSDSLRPRGLLDTRLPCPLLSPGVCSDSCLLSQ